MASPNGYVAKRGHRLQPDCEAPELDERADKTRWPLESRLWTGPGDWFVLAMRERGTSFEIQTYSETPIGPSS